MMRTAALMVALLLSTSFAHAEWVSVVRGDRAEFFFDPTTVKRKGQQREVWSMVNYRQPEMNAAGQLYRSTRTLLQFDCESKMARGIHSAFFKGSMLRGDMITEMGTLPEWEPVPPGTAIRDIFERVCPK